MSLSNDLSRRSIEVSTQVVRANTYAAQIEMLAVEMASFENLVQRHERVTHAMRAVEDLTRMFFSEERVSLSIESARFYEMSINSILSATGEVLPNGLDEVSYETAFDYSVEAEEKVGSGLKKIGTWLMDILTKIAEALKGMLSRFFGLTGKGKEKLQERLDKIKSRGDKKEEKKDDATEAKPSTEAKGAPIEVPDVKILGGTGVSVKATIDKAQTNTRKGAQDMLAIVRAVGEAAKRFNPQKHTSKDGLDDFMKDIMLSAGMEREHNGGRREFPIVNGTGVEITFNRKSDATVSAKAGKIEYTKTPGTMPGIDREEAIKLLEHLIQAYDNIDALRKPMETVSSVFGTMAKSMNEAYRATLTSVSGADKEAGEKAAQASRVYSTLGHVMATLGHLPSALLSGYLQVQYAADNYADKASRGF